jgi:hypothetical protein
MVSAVGCVSTLLTGCPVSTVKDFIDTVTNAVMKILAYIDPALGKQIQQDLIDVENMVAMWKTGTVPQNVINVITVLQDALDSVPTSVIVTPFIALALAALKGILLSTQTTSSSMKLAKVRVHVLPPIPKTRDQFVAAWDAQSDALGLDNLRIVSYQPCTHPIGCQ